MAQHYTAQDDQAELAAEPRPGQNALVDRDGSSYLSESLLTWLTDQIDDRVALSMAEQLDDQAEISGPVSRRDTRGFLLVCVTAALGAVVTIVSDGSVTTLSIVWAAITLINLAYFFRRP